MTDIFDKLNLRPQERRFVVAVIVVVLIILNYCFVWPYFSDWGKVTKNIETAKQTIKTYQTEIQNDTKKGGYQEVLTNTDKTTTSVVLKEGDVQLQDTVLRQAGAFSIAFSRYTPAKSLVVQTNQSFFDEQSATIDFVAEEKNLIDFLYAIGDDSSMIRVRELSLKPQDNNRFRLICTAKLTATYQKKPPAPAPSATATNKPISKPTLVSAKNTPTNSPAAAAAKKNQPPSAQKK